MTDLPIVIVVSKGDVHADDIVSNIRKIPIEDDCIELDGINAKGYKYNITTKYYKTDIVLVPIDGELPITTLTPLDANIEGLFVYFNANDRRFLNLIEKYAEYLKSHCIELGILLCDKLADEERDGVTYKEVKQISNLLDVIELGRTRDDDEEIEINSDHHDPVGYDEVQQVLRSFLWSNVQASGDNAIAATNPDGLFDQAGTDIPTEEDVERELAGFETLLTDLMAYKNNSENLSRNERFAYTQNFANAFDSLIGEGNSSSESVDDDDDKSAAAATPD